MIGIIWHTEDVLVADLPKDSSALPLLDDFAATTLFLLASEWPVKKSFFGQAAFVEFCFEFAKHSGSVIVLRISL